MQRVVICLGLVLSACAPARSQQTPKFELGGGYTYISYYSSTSASNLKMNGWNAWGDYNIFRWLGVAADFSGVYNTQPSSSTLGKNPNTQIYAFLAGPRFFPLGRRRLTPFAQMLLGGAHYNFSASAQPPLPGQSASDTAYSWLAGGGLDVRVKRHWGLRIIEVGVFHTRFFGGNPSHNNTRISAGLVYRFGEKRAAP